MLANCDLNTSSTTKRIPGVFENEYFSHRNRVYIIEHISFSRVLGTMLIQYIPTVLIIISTVGICHRISNNNNFVG